MTSNSTHKERKSTISRPSFRFAFGGTSHTSTGVNYVTTAGSWVDLLALSIWWAFILIFLVFLFLRGLRSIRWTRSSARWASRCSSGRARWANRCTSGCSNWANRCTRVSASWASGWTRTWACWSTNWANRCTRVSASYASGWARTWACWSTISVGIWISGSGISRIRRLSLFKQSSFKLR